MMQNRC